MTRRVGGPAARGVFSRHLDLASTGATSIWFIQRRRAGRRSPCSTHRPRQSSGWTSPARGILIPANRVRGAEFTPAIGAVADHAQDTPPLRVGALDVLAQHVLVRPAGAPVHPMTLSRGHDRGALRRVVADRFFDSVSISSPTAGYALKATNALQIIRRTKTPLRVANPMLAQRYA